MPSRALRTTPLRIVAGEATRCLRGLTIRAIDARDGQDHEGDPILRVRIVHAPGRPDPRSVAALQRRLRNRLQAAGCDAFPVIDLVDVRDIRNPSRQRLPAGSR